MGPLGAPLGAGGPEKNSWVSPPVNGPDCRLIVVFIIVSSVFVIYIMTVTIIAAYVIVVISLPNHAYTCPTLPNLALALARG